MLVEEVLSHGSMGLGRSNASQAAHIVAHLLDSVMAVGEEVLLQEVAQLEGKGSKLNSQLFHYDRQNISTAMT